MYWNTWRSPALQMMFCAILIWCTFIMYGRLYLGMHSPIDVARCRHVLLRLVVLFLFVLHRLDLRSSGLAFPWSCVRLDRNIRVL